MRLASLMISLFLSFFTSNAFAQCILDFYGSWQSKNGVFIKLNGNNYEIHSPKEHSIGNDSISMNGLFSYSKFVLSIVAFSAYNKNTNKVESIQRDLEFSVLDVDFQLMRLKPISMDAKQLFGENEVLFFNENFVSFESFRLDSLRYSYLHAPFELEINMDGEMRKRKVISYKSNYWRWYAGKLSLQEQLELKEIIFKSQILTTSKCGWINRSCSDCIPPRLLIAYNGNIIRCYENDKNIIPLMNHLYNIAIKSKWKKIKEKKK
jgi:hypothetical protein